MRSAWLAIVAVTLLATGAAGKERPQVVVVPDWRGGWTPDEKAKLATALGVALDQAGLDLVEEQSPSSREPFTVDPRFSSCLHREACRFEYARAVKATFLLATL